MLLDSSTGYYYYGARYYDPGASMFLSVDLHAEKYPNINPYTYVANNPINTIDLDGRDIVFIINKTRYKFDGTNLVNGKGNMVNPKSYQGTTVGRIVDTYKNLAKTDKHYKMQIQKLIDSKNDHLIDTDRKSTSGGGVKGGNEFDSKKNF
ncbi:RHS repeat-associated core domain-containing protein [Myroides odoratus]|uniref:RHS repeat-associated core domain-containing protein n=1 Tax=Myroides odoratus TaxID=256 RepID=UPI0039AF5013